MKPASNIWLVSLAVNAFCVRTIANKERAGALFAASTPMLLALSLVGIALCGADVGG